MSSYIEQLPGLVFGKGANGFHYRSTAEDVTQGMDLSGKTYLITGINSGIGRESGRVLALRGANIIGLARTVEKSQEALNSYSGEGRKTPIACELGEPDNVREAVKSVQEHLQKTNCKIDALLCNAGVMALPQLELVHGYDKQFFTNHIGHFILVTGLIDQLTETGRVVCTSSAAHMFAPTSGINFDNLKGESYYNSWVNYGQSKMANLLFAKVLAKRFEDSGSKRTAHSLHPGMIDTGLQRHLSWYEKGAVSLMGPLNKTIPQGAATQCHVATGELGGSNGEYWADCNVSTQRPFGTDMETALKLWKVSEEIVSKSERYL